MGGRWISKTAVEWAVYDAPGVPAHLLSTLIVYATFAGTDGRGAHPSAATVAILTRKAERNAKKDITALVKLGLLVPGDPRIVAHIRVDRRPAVYDLPIPRGDAHDTPSSICGVTHRTARGDAQGPDGVMQASPEQVLKRTWTPRARDSARAPRARAQTHTPRRAPPCPDCGVCYTQEQLADDEFCREAMAGTAGCVHPRQEAS
jgi:hypothetical protein